MNKYYAIAKNGSMNMGSDFMRSAFKKFLLNHDGARIEFSPVLPESANLRKFYFGAVVPLFTFFHEEYDYKSHEDLEKVHDFLKLEFNGEMVCIAGKCHVRGKTTTGGALKAYVERVIDDIGANGYPIELLKPEDYKQWKNEVFPYGGPENYIDYLCEIGKLNRKLK